MQTINTNEDSRLKTEDLRQSGYLSCNNQVLQQPTLHCIGPLGRFNLSVTVDCCRVLCHCMKTVSSHFKPFSTIFYSSYPFSTVFFLNRFNHLQQLLNRFQQICIGATIRTCREVQCVPPLVFFEWFFTLVQLTKPQIINRPGVAGSVLQKPL